ncbi:hypothetical protein ACFWAW_29075, partial [Streptomyces sp. NPDC059979]
DPMTYIFKGAGAGFSKIGDVMAGLKGMGKFEAPSINLDGAIALPDGAVMLPDGAIHLPSGAAIPEGAAKLPDGSIKLPEGTTTFPPGTVKLPGDGPTQFMDPKGNIFEADGSLSQHISEAPKGKPDAGADIPRVDPPKVDAPATARVPELELAGVGARGGDNAIRLDSDISTPVHAMDNGTRGIDTTPTARAGDHGTPGGHAGDNLPRNDLNQPARGADTPSPTGGTHPDTPGTAGTHPDGPGTGGTQPDAPSPGGGTHLPDTPSTGGVDDAARAGDDATTPANGTTPQRQPVPRPDFMRDGVNPYGPRGSLSRQQIEEIQIYRANEEPGYREHYYRKDGTRKSLEVYDESGITPLQLARLTDDAPWIRAKDVPAPPTPHYLDSGYIRVGADSVSDSSRLKVLETAAQDRYFAVQWDNLVADWKMETGLAHEAHGTAESAGLWAEARGTYKESHTQMGEKAEAFGEAAAEHHYIAERHPDFDNQPLLGPKNGNDQFDQMWKHDDGRVVVIEAKSSPGTELGVRTLPDGRKVSQGSREYFLDIIEKMKDRGEFEAVQALEDAIRDQKLEYVVVKGEKNAGTYTGYQYRRFDISKGTLP